MSIHTMKGVPDKAPRKLIAQGGLPSAIRLTKRPHAATAGVVQRGVIIPPEEVRPSRGMTTKEETPLPVSDTYDLPKAGFLA